mmetsp:Transcript_80728/g.159966  ORF Transcript_80728/g.159966 Transcript_80728/m.159966 type:complete len:455 (-) Transcript_80728:99-1463(-)
MAMEPSGALQPTCIARPPLQRRTTASDEAKAERQRMLEEWKKERYMRQPPRAVGGARWNQRGKENRAANGGSTAVARKMCPRGRQAGDGNPCLQTPKHRAHVNAVSPLLEIFQNNADTGGSSCRGSEKQGPTTPRPIIGEAATAFTEEMVDKEAEADNSEQRAKARSDEVMQLTVLEDLVPCPPGTPSSPSVRLYKSFNPYGNECYELPPELMVKILTELLEAHAEAELADSVPLQDQPCHVDHNCGVTQRLLDRLDQASEEEEKKEEVQVNADAELGGDFHVHEDSQPCEDSQFCEQSQTYEGAHICQESSQLCEDPQSDDEQEEFYDESQDDYEDLPQRLRRHVIQWGDPVPLTEEDLLSRAHDIYTFWFFETRERILNKLPEFVENPPPPLECIAEYPPDWPQWKIDSFDLREAARAARSTSLTPKARRTPPTPVLLGRFSEVEVTEDGIN